MSVVEILSTKYGIQSHPRSRINCPFCEHHTMSIKADDTIAKCFHDKCLRFITVHQSSPAYQRSLHSALEAIYHDFHQHFLSLADQPGPNVYDYCLNQRQIHQKVLHDAPLGCVPPGYEVSTAFEPVIKQLSDTTLKGNDLFVQINPITAMYHNFKDGDRVILETSMGRVRVRIHEFAGVREGVVLIPMGLGHSAFDKFQRGKGINAHRLFDVKKDAISGLAVWGGAPAKMTKA